MASGVHAMLTWAGFFQSHCPVCGFMKFEKPPLPFDKQANLLLQRGLEVDPDELARALEAVSYYRLSAYWYPFRNPDGSLKKGPHFPWSGAVTCLTASFVF